jgi:hypothetical protein
MTIVCAGFIGYSILGIGCQLKRLSWIMLSGNALRLVLRTLEVIAITYVQKSGSLSLDLRICQFRFGK